MFDFKRPAKLIAGFTAVGVVARYGFLGLSQQANAVEQADRILVAFFYLGAYIALVELLKQAHEQWFPEQEDDAALHQFVF